MIFSTTDGLHEVHRRLMQLFMVLQLYDYIGATFFFYADHFCR